MIAVICRSHKHTNRDDVAQTNAASTNPDGKTADAGGNTIL